MTSQCEQCMDAAVCVVNVLPEAWQQEIRARFNAHALGAIAGRVHADDTARYVPFRMASARNLTGVLTDLGADQVVAERVVAASWWALHLSGRDTLPHAVLDLAKQAVAWRAGYMLGTLNPALERTPVG